MWVGGDGGSGAVCEQKLLYEGEKCTEVVFRKQNCLTSYSNSDILVLLKHKVKADEM